MYLQMRVLKEDGVKIIQVPQDCIEFFRFLSLWAWELRVLNLSFSFTEAPEDYGDDDGDGNGEEEGEGEGDGDGDGDVPEEEEDEGRDSGGYYEEEEAEAEPYESQPASDSGHSMPDFTADVDIPKSEIMSEEQPKTVLEPEENVENKPGDFVDM